MPFVSWWFNLSLLRREQAAGLVVDRDLVLEDFLDDHLEIGEIVPVKITGAMAYDLTGVPEKKSIPLEVIR